MAPQPAPQVVERPAQIGTSLVGRHPRTRDSLRRRDREMTFRRRESLCDVDCDVAHVRCADLATVDALARAALNAHRFGARLRVVNGTPELEELIVLAGLDEVLLGRRQRQIEQREEAFGVEERGETGDPAV